VDIAVKEAAQVLEQVPHRDYRGQLTLVVNHWNMAKSFHHWLDLRALRRQSYFLSRYSCFWRRRCYAGPAQSLTHSDISSAPKGCKLCLGLMPIAALAQDRHQPFFLGRSLTRDNAFEGPEMIPERESARILDRRPKKPGAEKRAVESERDRELRE
jgi:hypothetical protein